MPSSFPSDSIDTSLRDVGDVIQDNLRFEITQLIREQLCWLPLGC